MSRNELNPPLFLIPSLASMQEAFGPGEVKFKTAVDMQFGPWTSKHTEYFNARLDQFNGREVIIQKGTSVGWTTSMHAVRWYVRAHCTACGSRLGICFKQCLHPLCGNYMQVQKIPVDSF
jgi:hypothetical protein